MVKKTTFLTSEKNLIYLKTPSKWFNVLVYAQGRIKKILIKLFSSVDIFQIQLLVNININSWKDL